MAVHHQVSNLQNVRYNHIVTVTAMVEPISGNWKASSQVVYVLEVFTAYGPIVITTKTDL